MTPTPASRQLEGLDIPAAGNWEIDTAHSSITAVARHMMVTKVRGHFRSFTGAVHIGERPEDSRVEIRIDAASIDTSNEGRDQHLRSPDFLDVERYPEITFRSTKVELLGGPRFRLEGDLTIRGVSRPVVLDAQFVGLGKDPWGGTRAGFEATTELDREDWGMTWNQALETGGVLVSKKLQVEIEVQALPVAQREAAA